MLRFLPTDVRLVALLGAGLLLNACSPATDAPATAAPPPTKAAPASKTAPADASAVLAAGQALFAQNCAICHGANGKLGLNGAHDLTKSNLNAAGRTYMVVNGLGRMPGFQGQLSDEQIAQVVAYSLTLR